MSDVLFMNDNVLWLFLTVPWVDRQCVIVLFPDHTHLLLEAKTKKKIYSIALFGMQLHLFNKCT